MTILHDLDMEIIKQMRCTHDFVAVQYLYSCPMIVTYKCSMCGETKTVEEGGIKVLTTEEACAKYNCNPDELEGAVIAKRIGGKAVVNG